MSQLIRLSSVRSTSISWLWPRYIPAGKLSILDGDPGCGKSMLTIDLAARLSRAAPLADGSTIDRPRRSLLLSAEDAREDTIAPRLVAANADLDFVFCLDGLGESGIAQLPRDVPILERHIREEGIDFVVIDPVMAFLPPAISTSSDQSVRSALTPLAKLAKRTGAAILMVRHLNKQHQQKALYRGGGSIGIVGAVRSALLAAPHPKIAGRFLLSGNKLNNGELSPTLAYRIAAKESSAAAIEWLGQDAMTAATILGKHVAEEKGIFRAMEWLLAALANGPRPASELLNEAAAAGIREKTLDRAKRQLGVKSQLTRRDDKRLWLWTPPPDSRSSGLPPLPDLPALPDDEEDPGEETLTPEARNVLNRGKLEWAERELKKTWKGRK